MLKIADTNRYRLFPDANRVTLQYTLVSNAAMFTVHDVKKHYVNTTNLFRCYYQIKSVTGKIGIMDHVCIRKSLHMFKFKELLCDKQ